MLLLFYSRQLKKGKRKMIKVNCLNPIAACGLDLLTDNYEKTEDFAEANAVLVRSAAMHDLELSDNLAAVARAGAGVNNIPLDKCAEKGIVVFNTPGANANGVKELVVAGLMLASRDIKGGMNWVDENKDNANIGKDMEKAKKAFAGKEIQGKKLGVIGLGAIGVLVANVATHLGMEVIGCDPFLSVQHALQLSRNVKVVKTNEEVYKECDYITVHVPALDSTKGMINKDTIAMMKDGAIVLNFARDVLVNDDDMAAAKEGIACTREFFKKMGLPQTLSDVGIDKEHFDIMAQKAADGCVGSFVSLSKEDIVSIFEAAL